VKVSPSSVIVCVCSIRVFCSMLCSVSLCGCVHPGARVCVCVIIIIIIIIIIIALCVVESLALISDVAAHVNESIRQVDNFKKLIEVQKKLIGDTGGSLISPSRVS